MNDEIILYRTADGKNEVDLLSRDGMVWLNQSQMAELFDTSVPNINTHINNILRDRELSVDSVIKNYLITATDGKKYTVKFYSLEMIMAVGFRVRSSRGVQFRQWANTHLTAYLRKGFVIDRHRLMNPDGRPDHFDELLEEIRYIRTSEKRFYQKIRDLFSLADDYDKDDKAVQMFFAEAQNKFLYAVTRNTAAEIILQRADSNKENMGLTSWEGRRVNKADVIVAKNYLLKDELDILNRIVTIFLDSAELRAKLRQSTTIGFWKENIDLILTSNGFPVLRTKGKRSTTQAEQMARAEYDKFNAWRKHIAALEADIEDSEELKKLDEAVKGRRR